MPTLTSLFIESQILGNNVSNSGERPWQEYEPSIMLEKMTDQTNQLTNENEKQE